MASYGAMEKMGYIPTNLYARCKAKKIHVKVTGGTRGPGKDDMRSYGREETGSIQHCQSSRRSRWKHTTETERCRPSCGGVRSDAGLLGFEPRTRDALYMYTNECVGGALGLSRAGPVPHIEPGWV